MTESERQSWEKARTEGRARFLSKNIANYRWILLGGLLVEVCWWLFTRELTRPMSEIAVGWVSVAVGAGAWTGILEWNTNERNYNESPQNSS